MSHKDCCALHQHVPAHPDADASGRHQESPKTHHPAHKRFNLRPSGRTYRTIRAWTTRMANSFFPKVVTILNSKVIWVWIFVFNFSIFYYLLFYVHLQNFPLLVLFFYVSLTFFDCESNCLSSAPQSHCIYLYMQGQWRNLSSWNMLQPAASWCKPQTRQSCSNNQNISNLVVTTEQKGDWENHYSQQGWGGR